MKKLFVLACALVVGASMSLGQGTTGSTDTKTGTTTTTTTKGKKHHHHKGGKKHKKSDGNTNTGTTNPK